jgi:hypothetical protein
LLDDPFVIEQASVWARALGSRDEPLEARVQRLYRQALARPPTAAEQEALRAFLADDPAAHLPAACHVLLNAKEFRYLP